MAAYVQKKKTWSDGEEVQLPGMVLLWDVVEAQVNFSSATIVLNIAAVCVGNGVFGVRPVVLWRRL